MPIFKTFSRRRKEALQSNSPDVYRYDELPQHLRVQIAHICRDALGEVATYGSPFPHDRWKLVYDVTIRERGLFNIGDEYSSVDVRCIKYFLEEEDNDHAIDFVELVFKVIATCGVKEDDLRYPQNAAKLSINDAIEELNGRFRQEGIGYAFEENEIIRIDSLLTHQQIVKPALALLSGKIFAKANEDYLLAHEHYRQLRYKDCIVAAQRSFESTMKAICAEKKWKYNTSDRATELIKVLRFNKFFPDYLDAGFDTFIAALKSGLPGVRNNAGGHGSDPSSKPIPIYIASYALNLAAVNILLLGEAYKNAS